MPYVFFSIKCFWCGVSRSVIVHVGKEQGTETERCELENILKNHHLHSYIHTIRYFTYVYKIISWHEKAEVPEQ